MKEAGKQVKTRLTIQVGSKNHRKQADKGKPAVKITEALKMLRQVHNPILIVRGRRQVALLGRK